MATRFVAWTRYAGGTEYRVIGRRLPAAGGGGPAQRLSAPGESAHTPEVAVDDAGDAVVAWGAFDGAHDLIEARPVSAAGVPGEIRTVSASGQDAFGQQVATDADGDAVVAWVRLDGTSSRVQARALPAGGQPDPTRTLSRVGQDAVNPAVASAPGGSALVLWQRFDGANARIQGAAGP